MQCLSWLLLVLVCMASSTVCNCSRVIEEEGEVNININMITITNDSPDRLDIVASFQPTEIIIDAGDDYRKLVGGKLQDCDFKFFDKFGGTTCAALNVYDPVTDAGHHSINWSIREDGLYHSWDRTNWDKRAGWGKCTW